MPRRSIAEVKVLDVQKRRIPNKHYVSGSALRGSGSSAAPGPALGKQRPGAAGPPGAPGGRRAALPVGGTEQGADTCHQDTRELSGTWCHGGDATLHVITCTHLVLLVPIGLG